jgi:hypothetical protein
MAHPPVKAATVKQISISMLFAFMEGIMVFDFRVDSVRLPVCLEGSPWKSDLFTPGIFGAQRPDPATSKLPFPQPLVKHTVEFPRLTDRNSRQALNSPRLAGSSEGRGSSWTAAGSGSATPLSCGRWPSKARGLRVRAKAPSPLRFAGAVHDARGLPGAS